MKWEYKMVDMLDAPGKDIGIANADLLGQHGWELISTNYIPFASPLLRGGQLIGFFKRPLEDLSTSAWLHHAETQVPVIPN